MVFAEGTCPDTYELLNNSNNSNNSFAIAAKLAAIPPEADQPQAEASASRNPENSKTSGFRFPGNEAEGVPTFFNELPGQNLEVST